MKEYRAMVEHLSPLVGKTVKELAVDPEGVDGEPVFGLAFTDGTVAWIMCDPEGNGPGFLDLEKKKSLAEKVAERVAERKNEN